MINSSLSSTQGQFKEKLRYSLTSVTPLVEHAHYSRHLSSKHGIRLSKRKSRKIIHVTIRQPKNNCRSREKNSVDSTRNLYSVKKFYLLSHLFSIYFYIEIDFVWFNIT